MILSIVLTLIGVEVVWLVGANVLLKSHGIVSGWVNRRPEKIRMDWSSAQSYWPGDLRVQGFQIRGILLTAQWSLSMDTAQTQVGLRALLDKCFLGRGLVGEGVTLHVRRLPLPDETRRRDLVVAPIPWADSTPRPPAGEVKSILAAQVRPPPKKIWAIDLPHAQALSVREIWIDEFCYHGHASAQGSFFMRPKEKLDVESASIQAGPGSVKLGTEEVLKVRSARLGWAFPRVDTTVYRGSDVYQKMDATIALDAGVPDLRFVNFYLDRFPGVDIQGTPGELTVNWSVAQGVLEGPVVLAGKEARMSFRGIALRGDLNIEAKVNRWSFGEKTMDLAGTTASVTNVTIDEAGKQKALAEGWYGKALLGEATLSLDLPRKLEAHVSGKVQDSRPLLEFFRGGRELPGLLKLALSDHDLDTQASLRLGGGVAEINLLEMTGDKLHLEARLKLEKNSPPQGILYLKRGIFAMGLETGGERKVKLINPREWFEAHPLLREEVPR